jgi:hypothetical protein
MTVDTLDLEPALMRESAYDAEICCETTHRVGHWVITAAQEHLDSLSIGYRPRRVDVLAYCWLIRQTCFAWSQPRTCDDSASDLPKRAEYRLETG